MPLRLAIHPTESTSTSCPQRGHGHVSCAKPGRVGDHSHRQTRRGALVGRWFPALLVSSMIDLLLLISCVRRRGL